MFLGHRIVGEERSADELRKFIKDQPYKIELINDILSKNVDEYGNPLPAGVTPKLTTYTHATFTDLCKGPHVPDLSKVNPEAIKLLRVAGAYWRGDEARPMLQRIYGTAFENEAELTQYLHSLEEAKRRDHRVIGKQQDFFSFSDDVGPGLALWHPKGATVRRLAPVQATIIPISDRHADFAYQVKDRLGAASIRSEVNASDERMQAKIRDSETHKIPFSVVIGDKEVTASSVSVRARGSSDSETLTVDAFIARLRAEVEKTKPAPLLRRAG